jgi:hypothetical protein
LHASVARTLTDATEEPPSSAPLSRSSPVSHEASITPAFSAVAHRRDSQKP